ncbi:MAG: YkuS family protein [Thermoanaerobacteraceae bacterium]|nr:YkuS family protein [Thermoanaerobacteraceae bacterium]
MKNIAVQKGLKPVAEHLSRAGYRVYEFDFRQKASKDFLDGFDAIVFTGMNDNIMGIQETVNNVPIIEARGMTPEEIKNTIEQRLQ